MKLLAIVVLLLASGSVRGALETAAADAITAAAGTSWLRLSLYGVLGASVLCALGLTWLCRTDRTGLPKNARLPPVYQTGLPLIGPFLSFAKDPLGTISRARSELGSVFTINMFHMKSTFLVGSVAHKAFFEADDDELDQAPVYKFMVPVFGRGVLYDAPLPKRKQQLRFLGKSLKPADLRQYPMTIAKEARMYFAKWQEEKTVDILHAMADLTILTASATLHGPEVRENLFEDVSRLFAKMDAGISPLSVVAPNLPTPAHLARNEAHKEMIQLFSKVIRQRRARLKAEGPNAKKGNDMLQKLMDAMYKPDLSDATSKLEKGQITSEEFQRIKSAAKPRPIPEHEIAGMLIAALFAGQHTSSITISWTLMFLLDDARNGGPWLDRVREELRSVEPAPGAFARGEVDHETVNKMSVMHACIKEALRMYPPLIILMRQVVRKPLEVEGYHVPIGHNVMVSNAVAQRLPEIFENPNKYNPARWLDFDIRKYPPYSFIGFGAGIHTCMGESFAFMQLRTILAVMLSTFDVTMLGPLPPADYEAMVVMPKGKNMIKFVRRAGAGEGPAAPVDLSKPIAITWDDLEAALTGKSSKPSAKETKAAAPVDMYLDEDTADADIPGFTLEQIAQHAKRDDLWIIVSGKVYDVTTYLPVHQGGDAILKWAGKDATDAVFGPQHPSTVPQILKRYLVGRVVRS